MMTADHDTYSDEHLRNVLRSVRSIAVVGASSNSNRPSSFVTRYMGQKGYRMVPVNPGHPGEQIAGFTASASLAELEEPVDMVDVFRRIEALPEVTDEILAMSVLPKVVWFQLGLRDDEIAGRLEAAGITVIQDRCPKIEYARLCGEIGWTGFNRRTISARKPKLAKGFQAFTLDGGS